MPKGAKTATIEADSQELSLEEEEALLGAEDSSAESESEGATPAPDRFGELLAQNRQMMETFDRRMKGVEDFVTDYQHGIKRSEEKIAEAERKRDRPDPEVDPYGALQFDFNDRFSRLEQSLKPYQDTVADVKARTEQQRLQAEYVGWATNDVAGCRQRHEDYEAVTTQLFNAMHGLARDNGFADDQALGLINTFVTAISQGARMKGISAAENFYRLGKTLFGNLPAEMAARRSPLATAAGELERLRTGTRLRGAAGGQSGTSGERLGHLNPQRFDALSDDEYARLMANPKTRLLADNNFRRLEGVYGEPEYEV